MISYVLPRLPALTLFSVPPWSHCTANSEPPSVPSSVTTPSSVLFRCIGRDTLGLREALMPRPASGDGRLQVYIPNVVQTPTMSTADWLRAGRLAQEA